MSVYECFDMSFVMNVIRIIEKYSFFFLKEL